MAHRAAQPVAYRFTRARDMETNPATFASRASTFAATFTGRDFGTLIAKKTPSGVETFLISTQDNDRPARDLGTVVGGKYEHTELPELNTPSVGHLTLNSGGATARETTSGVDPTELSRQLVTLLSDEGSWVAVTFRSTTTTEKNRHRQWLSHRLGNNTPTHHTSGLGTVVIKVMAGSDDDDTTRVMLEQLTRALPGFDLETRASCPSPASEAAPAVAVAAAVAAAAGAGWFFAPTVITHPILFTLTATLFTLAVLVAFSRWRGWTITRGHWLELAIANEDTEFYAPGKWRGLRYKKPRREHVGKDGKIIPEQEGDYPFASDTFCVGPTVIAGLVAPQAGVASGERVSVLEQVPPVFLEPIGPYIGDTQLGRVHLSAAETLFGTAIVGKPGSGKSRLIHALFAWSMLEKRDPSGRPGFPGHQNTLIAFESKGGGMPSYRAWADAIGDELLVIDLNRHDSYAIDLLDVPGTYNERANFFVNAMIYAFGKDAIGDRSFRTLTTAIAGGLCVTPTVAANMSTVVLPDDAGPLFFANIILGSKGYKEAIELMAAITAQANTFERDLPKVREALTAGAYDADPAAKKKAARFVTHATSYIEAAHGLRDLSGRTEANFKTYVEAPSNKVFQLMESAGRSWFSASRPKMSWKRILEDHKTVVINTGASELGDAVPDRFAQQVSSMLLFSLKENISRHCVEWLSVGRSVSIFSDELSLLAGHSSEVLQWVRDQGRSFGVRPFFATQRPEQLPRDVRAVFLNFATLISFAQDEKATAGEIASAIETDGDWTDDMIMRLPPFTAAVRAQHDMKRQMAFSARIANFESDRTRFVAWQGRDSHNPAAEHGDDDSTPGPTFDPPAPPSGPPAARRPASPFDDDPDAYPDLSGE